MNRMLALCAAVAIYGTVTAAGAQVYRCDSGGKVTYTDAPCGSGAVRSVDLPANPLAPARQLSAPAEALPKQQSAAPAQQIAPTPVSCPSEVDIKNIHTRLSAKVIPAGNRAALHRELAKAERCIAIGGRYSYEDRRRLESVLRGED